MKNALMISLLVISLSSCSLFKKDDGGATGGTTPPPSSTPARTLKSCDVLEKDEAGNPTSVNCNWSSGEVTHHSTCDRCGH